MPARWPDVLFTIILAVGVLICLAIIAWRDLSTTESLLLSLVLTILSLLGSWIASRHYAESSFNSNLRVFALKAAEKVNNLSNELDRLSAFLQHELEPEENLSPDEMILSKEATIVAAIHMITTLKSVNDTSLSDWQGVIGEELSAQKEEREEREEDLRELVDRIEQLSLQMGDGKNARDATALLSKEVSAIKSDLRMLASQVGGVPVRRQRSNRQDVEFACPACSNALRYKQKTKEGSFKTVFCTECKSKLLSVYSNGSFLLTLNLPQPVRASCPVCNQDLNAMLEIVPGKTATVTCTQCQSEIRLVRAKNEVRARLVSTQQASSSEIPFTDAILKGVEQLMPPQPWPKGTARIVADRLGLPYEVVSRAIKELMARGVFKLQVDGKLYEQIPDSQVNTSE